MHSQAHMGPHICMYKQVRTQMHAYALKQNIIRRIFNFIILISFWSIQWPITTFMLNHYYPKPVVLHMLHSNNQTFLNIPEYTCHTQHTHFNSDSYFISYTITLNICEYFWLSWFVTTFMIYIYEPYRDMRRL